MRADVTVVLEERQSIDKTYYQDDIPDIHV